MTTKPTVIRKARAGDLKPTSSGEIEGKNRNIARATVIGPVLKSSLVPVSKGDATTGNTKAIPEDNFLDTLIAANKIVEPPFDPLVLAMLQEHSTELHGIVEAMEINVDGFGHHLDSRVKADEDADPKLKKDVAAERIRLLNFFHNCNVDDSFTMLRRKTRHDLELTGNAYWEIIRSPINGEIQGINHIPTHQMRLGAQDKEFTEYTRNCHVLQPDGSVELKPEQSMKRFRRYVQAKLGTLSRSFGPGRGHPVRWFKEFGDPRTVDNRDGEYVPEDKVKALEEAHKASEVIHWRIYSARTPYGLPRFIGNLITIFGDRAADEINFITLRNNNIPSMAVLVSNGQLTDGSIQRIQEFVETQIQGSENYSRFLIVEAEPASEGMDGSTGAMKLDIKPLTDQQMRDQLFQEYNKNNAEKLRRAWRLPPIFVGSAQDYSKATAEESRRLADEQIFKPERDEFDNRFNKTIMAELGARFHKFVSHGPNVTDDQDLIQVLMAAERTGGMTPKLAREIVGNIMGKELPEIKPDKLDPDIPFSLQLAEKVKNEAAQQTGGPEVGSQVTALKRGIIGQILGHRDELEAEVDRVLAVRRD